jgi:hypothetical protein
MRLIGSFTRYVSANLAWIGVLQKLKPFYVIPDVFFAIDRLIHEIREK